LGCLLAGVLLFAFVLTPTRSEAETAAAQPVYDFGVVPQFAPRQLAAKWRPLLDDLHRRTGLRFRLVGAPQIPAFEKAFAAGAFDFSYMNPLHAMIAMRWGLYVPLVRDGAKLLQGILVVAKTNPMQSVRDLEGRPVAYPAPNALGASLALRAELLTKFGVNTQPLYVKTHTSVYLHVALGQAQAGGGVQATLDRQPARVRDRLRILYRTRTMPPHPVMAHKRVSKAHRDKVRRALLAMNETPHGAKLLSAIPMGRAVEATLDDYRTLEKMELEKLMTPIEPPRADAASNEAKVP
jgi:phosphonate transport system substrate-binding protein